MQASDIPSKSQRVFAQDATGSYVRTVPQTSGDPAAASFSLGFPPQTFTDESAGGTPPDGRDFNGILNFLSAWARWFAAGGPTYYDAAFQTSIGGYPSGAIVQSTATPGLLYVSTVNNNVTNPQTGGAGWTTMVPRRASSAEITAGVEDGKAITPAGLAASGAQIVTSQNLNQNGGWRIFASGYKECWGTQSFAPNTSTVVNYPITFTTFSNARLSATITGASAQDNNPGVTDCGLTSFTSFSAADSALTGWWHAFGV